MKSIYKWMFTLCLSILILGSCKKDDAEDRVFKQHLMKRVTEVQTLLNTVTFGDDEGQYKMGTADALVAEVDKATKIYWDMNSSQKTVDDCFAEIAVVRDEFKTKVNPVVSVLRDFIATCISKMNTTNVGDGDGMIPSQADKDILQVAIDEANDFLANTQELTQKMVDDAYARLQKALSAFEGKIPGLQNVFIENYSFENPAITTGDTNSDFGTIPGWDSESYLPGITATGKTPNSVVNNKKWYFTGGNARTIPDGNNALIAAGYWGRVWQYLQETVHTNSTYTLSFYYARGSSSSGTDTRLGAQVLVFNGKANDFSDITILKEDEILAVEKVVNFTERQLIIDIPATSPYVGKRMAISFRGYISKPWTATTDPGFSWNNNNFVAIDKVTMVRDSKK